MTDSQVEYGLHQIILSNPAGVSALVGELGFEGVSSASLVRAQIRNPRFADELSAVVGPDFDMAVGNTEGSESTRAEKRRQKVGEILSAAINGLQLVNQVVKPQSKPQTEPGSEVRVKTKEDPRAKIWGIPKAVFFLAVAVVLLISVYAFLNLRGK